MTLRGRARWDALLDALPIARWAFYEVQLIGIAAAALAVGIAWLEPPWRWLAVVPIPVAWCVVWFYRDPPRQTKPDPSAFYAPADGKVVSLDPTEHDDGIGGPATRIGIFLSVFDVHLNRAPRSARVVRIDYREGKHRDARSPESVRVNESQRIGFEDASGRRFAVRQVSGAVARRIVCDLAPGDKVEAGQKFGMIKLGSRAELIIPAGAEIACRVGDRVRAGQTVLARLAAGDAAEGSGKG